MNGKDVRNLELLGFVVIGNVRNYLLNNPFQDYKSNREVNIELFINSEIIECIIDDLLEAIENDLEEGDNCNPVKWVKEMMERGILL